MKTDSLRCALTKRRTIRNLFLAILLAVIGQGTLAQRLPPDPHTFPKHRPFFKALPDRFPALGLEALAPLVADDLQIYSAGKLVRRSKQEWFDQLQRRPRDPDEPQGYTVDRTYVGIASDGGIIASEFSFPVPPANRNVTYHPLNPRVFATYYFRHGRLVRIMYTTNPPARAKGLHRE